MSAAIQTVTVILPVLYVLCTVTHGMAFAGEKAPPVERLRRRLLLGTLVVHLSLFVAHYAAAGGLPVLDTWLVVSLVAFTVTLV